jgi:hypothetical protein
LVVPVYTSCVPRGALRFFIKFLLIKKKVIKFTSSYQLKLLRQVVI